MKKSIINILNTIAIIISLLTLLGWYFGLNQLTTYYETLSNMKVNTALLVLALSISFIFIKAGSKSVYKFAAICLSLLVIIFSLLTIYEFASGVNLGIDQLFFKEQGTLFIDPLPGRMGLNTAICFLFLGCSILIIALNRENYKFHVTFFIAVCGTMSALSVVLNLFVFNDSITVGEFTKFSLPASIALLFLSIGLLLFVFNKEELNFYSEHAFFGGLVSIFVLMFLITFSMISNINQLNESSDWVKHTYEVKSELKKSSIYSGDITRLILQYNLTKNLGNEKKFERVKDSLIHQIQLVKDLTIDSASEHKLLDTLDSIIRKKIILADSFFSVLSDKTHTENAINELFNYENSTDSISKSIISKLTNNENDLLISRIQKQKLKTEHAKLLIFIAASVQFMLVILVFFLVQSALLRRKKSEVTLKLLNRRLEEKIDRRTEELAEMNAALKKEIEIRIASEEQIKILNDGLEQRVAERTMQLEQINSELEAFSYSVSHDLRAPLRHIDGYIDLILKKSTNEFEPKIQRYFQIISESAKKMGRLIDDLLTFSKLGRAELYKRKIDMREIFINVIDSFADEIKKRNIQIEMDGEMPMVNGDMNLMEYVATNLISNAVKYTQTVESPRILIGSQIDGSEVVFFVKDNGVGFDMKYADKLFGVFQRLHRTDEFEGIGIGLANVKRIVSRHGGKIWAYAELNKGAEFYFTMALFDYSQNNNQELLNLR